MNNNTGTYTQTDNGYGETVKLKTEYKVQYTPNGEQMLDGPRRGGKMGGINYEAAKWALIMAVAVTVAAVLVGGLVFGIYICVVKGDNDPTVYYPLKVAFWAGLAGGVFAFLVLAIMWMVRRYRPATRSEWEY
jgi:hypothetical protein